MLIYVCLYNYNQCSLAIVLHFVNWNIRYHSISFSMFTFCILLTTLIFEYQYKYLHITHTRILHIRRCIESKVFSYVCMCVCGNVILIRRFIRNNNIVVQQRIKQKFLQIFCWIKSKPWFYNLCTQNLITFVVAYCAFLNFLFSSIFHVFFFQSYATLSRGNKSVTTCSPVSSQPTIQLPINISLLSPNNHNQSLVTSSLSEYRFRPEVVTTSNRIQESCI